MAAKLKDGPCECSTCQANCDAYRQLSGHIDADHAAKAYDEQSAKIAELRAALEAIQWGSCDGCGQHQFCPLCKGGWLEWDTEKDEQVPRVHAPDCIVGKALK